MESSIFEAFSPLCYVSKLSGFALFTINRADLTATIQNSDLILQMLWTCITTTLNVVYWNTYFNISSYVHKSDIIKITFPLLLYGNFIIYTFYMFWSVIMRKSIAKILKILHEIDYELSYRQITYNYKQQRAFNWKVLICVFTISTTIIASGAFCQYKFNMISDAKAGIYLLWGSHCGTLLIVQYNLTLLAIKQRFKSINQYIKLMCPINLPQEIKYIAKIHMKLTETIKLINKVFSPIIMLFIAISFVWLCIFLFSLSEFGSDLWSKYFMLIIVKFSLNGYVTIQSLSIIWMSVTTTEEGTATMQHLFDISNHSKDICRHDVRNKIYYCITSFFKILLRQVMYFVQQIAHSPMKFTCGFFAFDWKFCFQVIMAFNKIL